MEQSDKQTNTNASALRSASTCENPTTQMSRDVKMAMPEDGLRRKARKRQNSHASGRSSHDEVNVRKKRRQAESSLKPPAAAKCQRWWKALARQGKLTRQLLESFFAKGISLHTASAISFEELASQLREPAMLEVMQAIVLRIFHISFGRKGTLKIVEPNLNIRVFLAAYMIRFRPTSVFEHASGALEKELYAASEPLLDTFHRICDVLREKQSIHDVARDITDPFPDLLDEYVTKFRAWKIPDEAKLSERIKHAISALYMAEAQLSSDEPEGSKLRLEFRAQQERLRYKLMQVAGQQVLRSFDAEKGRADLPLPTQESAAAAGATSSAAGAGGSGTTAAAAATIASPNMYSSLPGRMSNEQLAHELLLNADFKLDDKGGSAVENPIFSRIRESFHKAFWDSLVDDLRLSPPCYVRVIRVLSEIRDGISELANGTKEAASIDQVVDMKAIQADVDAGRLEWGGCVRLVQGIVGVVQRMQAPCRDAETREQWAAVQVQLGQGEEREADRPGVFCRALEFVLDRVNAVRIDAANSRLRMIAPVIKLHGVDYERAHLDKKLKAGLTLARTDTWLGDAVRAAVEDGRVQLRDLEDGKGAAFKVVHEAAMLALVTAAAAVTSETCPETLLLDVHRLQRCHAEFHFAVRAVAALLELQNPQRQRKEAAPMAAVTKFLVEHTPRSADVQALQKELELHLKAEGVAEAECDMVKQIIESTASDTNAVRRVCHARLVHAWTAVVGTGELPEPHQLPPIALPLVDRILKHARTLQAVTHLNLRVHATHCNKIISAVTTTITGRAGPAAASVPVATRTPAPAASDGDGAPGGPA